MKVLVTGAAGFIGMHVSQILLARGDQVVGLDNLNDYYSPQLKHDRLARLTPKPGFSFVQMDVADRAGMARLFAEQRFDRVVHLAAQAGVRYSIENPHAYIDSNIVGFTNILEGCRHSGVQHLAYASSSSVYGGNTLMPFSEHHSVDHPISLYAATKKANELMAHTYSHLFGLPTTGLCFFTVYGPWGRPDMALFLFTKAIIEGRAINVFNHGKMIRDFTYIDDIAEGVVRVLDRTATADPAYDAAKADPAPLECTLPRVQHRQPRAHRTDELHRGHRAGGGPRGHQEFHAHAGRRCAGHARGRGGTGRLDGLPTRHARS